MTAEAVEHPQRVPGRRWQDRTAWVLWVAMLVSIPVTSHPAVAGITGWTGVSPLSGIPLALLLIAWLPWRLAGDRRLPVVALPLLAFVSVSLVSSAGAFLLPISPSVGQSVLGRELRALLTLGVGAGFFLVAAMLPRARGELIASLRWIYVGAAVLLAYSGFQVARLPYAFNPVPDRLIALHRLFSIRDPFRSRVTGFAYEPSWLGDQLVVLYVPLLLASVWLAFSAFSRRRRRLSPELLLLAAAIVVLFFTFARLAWLSFFIMLGSLLVASVWRRTERGPSGDRSAAAGAEGRPRHLPRVGVVLLAVLLLTGLGVALVFAASALDTRFAASLAGDLELALTGRTPWPYALANYLKYGERMMYWVGGFRVFSQYPVFGVGLGNVGFLLPTNVPGYAFTMPEAIETLRQGAFGVPNTKSLWIRLLAETGIVGFSMFTAWIAAVGVVAARILRRGEIVAQTLGLAALLALGALVIEGFSLDSFALPQMWILPGLAVAAGKLSATSAAS